VRVLLVFFVFFFFCVGLFFYLLFLFLCCFFFFSSVFLFFEVSLLKLLVSFCGYGGGVLLLCFCGRRMGFGNPFLVFFFLFFFWFEVRIFGFWPLIFGCCVFVFFLWSFFEVFLVT